MASKKRPKAKHSRDFSTSTEATTEADAKGSAKEKPYENCQSTTTGDVLGRVHVS